MWRLPWPHIPAASSYFDFSCQTFVHFPTFPAAVPVRLGFLGLVVLFLTILFPAVATPAVQLDFLTIYTVVCLFHTSLLASCFEVPKVLKVPQGPPPPPPPPPPSSPGLLLLLPSSVQVVPSVSVSLFPQSLLEEGTRGSRLSLLPCPASSATWLPFWIGSQQLLQDPILFVPFIPFFPFYPPGLLPFSPSFPVSLLPFSASLFPSS